jgi:hypothetical protein
MVRISFMGRGFGLGPRGLCFAGALVLLSCREEPGLMPLDSRLVLRLAEDEHGVQVNVSTEKSYPCERHSIVSRRSRQGSLFQIAFAGVRSPDGPCVRPAAPASEGILLGPLEAGDYLISFAAPGKTARVNLRVTAESLLVVGGESAWMTWEAPGSRRR